MNKQLKYTLQTLSLVTIILAFVWIKKSFPAPYKFFPSNSKPDTAITIIQYIDSSTHIVNQVSKFTYKESLKTPSFKIDTQAIISRYFTKRITVNSYRDSNLSLTVIDTLFQNEISGRSFNYKILKANTQVTKTITNGCRGLYVGVGYLPSAGLYPNVSYTFGNWQLGAGLAISNKQSIPILHLQYKIK